MSDFSFFILSHLWESTLFGVACAALILALGKSWSYNRHLLAWASILKFLLPLAFLTPLLSITKSLFLAKDPVVAPVASYIGFTSKALQIDTWIGFGNDESLSAGWISWESAVICGWALGFLALTGLWIRQFYLTSRAIRRGCASAGEDWQSLAERVWEKPLRAMPRILVCLDENLLAGVFGFHRPAVIIPSAFASNFNREEREAFLRHEFQHVYKRDTLWLFVQKLIRNLFWMHPLVWWLDRQISAEREILRDEEVIRKTENVASYLNCLMKASNIKLPRSYATSVGIKGSPFARRIKAISRIKPSRLGDFLSAAGSITAVLVLTLFLSAALSLSDLQAADEKVKKGDPTIKDPPLSDEEHEIMKEVFEVAKQRGNEEALALVYEAITEDSSAVFEFVAGSFHATAGELEKAIELHQVAIDKSPNFLRAVKNLAKLQLRLERFEEAKQSLLYAQRLGANDSATHGLLGLCYIKLDDWGSAEHYYRLAVEDAPQEEVWHLGLAKSLYQQGKKAEADAVVQNLAESLREQGKVSEAEQVLKNGNLEVEALNSRLRDSGKK